MTVFFLGNVCLFIFWFVKTLDCVLESVRAYRKALSQSDWACCCIHSLSQSDIKGLPSTRVFALVLNRARERLWKGSPLHCLGLFVSSVSLWFHPGTQQLPCPPTTPPNISTLKKSHCFVWPCIPWDKCFHNTSCELWSTNVRFISFTSVLDDENNQEFHVGTPSPLQEKVCLRLKHPFTWLASGP